MLPVKDYSLFHGRMYFKSNEGSQIMFAYQTATNAIELKKSKIKLIPLYTVFLNSTKLSGYRTGRKFNNRLLVVEQNNYKIKIVNVYIMYDFQNCLFGATNILKNNVKDNFVYSDYGIAFDGAGQQSSNNDSARNIKNFGVNKSSLSHSDNQKNSF